MIGITTSEAGGRDRIAMPVGHAALVRFVLGDIGGSRDSAFGMPRLVTRAVKFRRKHVSVMVRRFEACLARGLP